MFFNKSFYRPSVGIALINKDCNVFVGRRVNDNQNIWQMPQGGINKNESPEDAAYRELWEETGIKSVKLISKIDKWLYYDIPVKITNKYFKKYKGQKQLWFLMYFNGDIDEIVLDHSVQEFICWKWSSWSDVCNNVIFFKKDVYQCVVNIFEPIAKKYVETFYNEQQH